MIIITHDNDDNDNHDDNDNSDNDYMCVVVS